MPTGKLRRNVGRTKRELGQSRKRDYRRASNIISAIYGNLRGTLKGRGRAMTTGNQRTLEAMERLVTQQAIAGSKTTEAEAAAVDLYGGGVAGMAEQSFAPAELAAALGGEAAASYSGAAVFNAETANEVLRIAKQGAKEGKAGAKYATAEALTGRAKADATTLAGMRHDIALTEAQQEQDERMLQLQHQMNLEASKKQLRWEMLAAQGELGKTFKDRAKDMDTVSSTAADLSATIRAFMNEAENGDLSAQGIETADAVAVQNVLDHLTREGLLGGDPATDPGGYELARRLFSSIKRQHIYGGTYKTWDTELEAISEAIRQTYDWVDSPKKQKALMRRLRASLGLRYANAATPKPGPEEPGFWERLFAAGDDDKGFDLIP